MDTVTLNKSDYQKLIKRQDDAEEAITRLTHVVKVLSQDEVTPAVAKHLEKQSQLIDAGRGKRFGTMKSFRTYVRGL